VVFNLYCLWRLHAKISNGFLIGYSICSDSTLDAVKKLLQEIFEIRGKDKDSYFIPIVVFGNKSDLEDKRVVSFEQVSNYFKLLL